MGSMKAISHPKNGKEWDLVVTVGTTVLVPHHSRKVSATHLKIRYGKMNLLLSDKKILLREWGHI